MDHLEYIEQKDKYNQQIKEKKTEIKVIKENKKILKTQYKEQDKKPLSSKKQAKIAKREQKKAKNIKINQPPHLTILEEIGNAVTHGLGSIFAIMATSLMMEKANTTKEVIASIIYGLCMLILFLMSCLYHSFKYGSTVKRIFRRFDYSSIYLLIGGTFAPILLLFLNNTLGLVIFIAQWVIIITGITFVGVFGPGRLKWLHFPLYFILGWGAGIFVIPTMITTNITLFWWILAGGVVYTLGMIPFCMGEQKNAHFIWHFFVLVGAILQWIGIYIYLF